jgi:hypothetical protein
MKYMRTTPNIVVRADAGGPDCLQSGRRRHKRRHGNRQIALAPGPVPMERMIGVYIRPKNPLAPAGLAPAERRIDRYQAAYKDFRRGQAHFRRTKIGTAPHLFIRRS